jgi:hypothetical protein
MLFPFFLPDARPNETQEKWAATYRGHSQVALEPPPDAVIDTLGLAPCRVQALEPVALMAHEALRACKSTYLSIPRDLNIHQHLEVLYPGSKMTGRMGVLFEESIGGG